MADDNDCTEAVVEYVRGLGEAFRMSGEPIVSLEDERWVRSPDGLFRRQIVPSFSLGLFPATYRQGTVGPGSAAFGRVREAIEVDADFGPVVRGQVGDVTHYHDFTAETVVDHAMSALWDETGLVQFSPDLVRQQVREVRDYVTADVRTCTVIVPLPGVTSDNFPVVIDDGVAIDELTNAEVTACASSGILNRYPGSPAIHRGEDCVGARVTVPMTPVRVGPGEEVDIQRLRAEDEPPGPRSFGERSAMRFAAILDDILLVLRLARPERVSTHGIVRIDHELPGTSRAWQQRFARQHLIGRYVLDEGTVATVRELWTKLKSMTSKRGLPAIAVRRFNAAMDRATLDDSIVDFVIAAEALLLKDAGSTDQKTEMGYRMSQRAGVLLESRGRNRRATFKLSKKGYDVRSTIAHGGDLDAEVKVPERAAMPAHVFVSELSDFMRDVLLAALDDYASDPPFGTSEYWDAKILGAGPPVQQPEPESDPYT